MALFAGKILRDINVLKNKTLKGGVVMEDIKKLDITKRDNCRKCQKMNCKRGITMSKNTLLQRRTLQKIFKNKTLQGGQCGKHQKWDLARGGGVENVKNDKLQGGHCRGHQKTRCQRGEGCWWRHQKWDVVRKALQHWKMKCYRRGASQKMKKYETLQGGCCDSE